MNHYELDYINSRLIELNNFVYANPLLPFGTVKVANTHCTHLQIAEADTQSKICKRVQFQPSLKELYRHGIHGIEHAFRVLILVQRLSELENISFEQKNILEFCAIFHDIGRINDDVDDQHGKKSIKKLEKYQFFGLNNFNNNLVKYIIENHCISDNIAFNNVCSYNIENYSEASYLLKVLKDADNLDRVRLGDFESKYLRLNSSPSLVSYANRLFKNNSSHIPLTITL